MDASSLKKLKLDRNCQEAKYFWWMSDTGFLFSKNTERERERENNLPGNLEIRKRWEKIDISEFTKILSNSRDLNPLSTHYKNMITQIQWARTLSGLERTPHRGYYW